MINLVQCKVDEKKANWLSFIEIIPFFNFQTGRIGINRDPTSSCDRLFLFQ